MISLIRPARRALLVAAGSPARPVSRPLPDLNRTVVWSGSASRPLGASVARMAGLPMVTARTYAFPDGEVCVDLPADAADETVIVVQGTHPPQDRNVRELYQLVEEAARLRARRIVCLVPYLAGGAGILRALHTLGATHLVTVDPHGHAAFADSPIPVTVLSATDAIAGWLVRQRFSRPLLVAPDHARRARVEAIGRRCRMPTLAIEKTRAADGTTVFQGGLRADHCDTIVVDDVCTTGSTLVPLGRVLMDAGARSLTATVTHLLADRDEIERGIGAPVTFAATDTVPGETPAISVLPLLGRWIDSAS